MKAITKLHQNKNITNVINSIFREKIAGIIKNRKSTKQIINIHADIFIIIIIGFISLLDIFLP